MFTKLQFVLAISIIAFQFDSFAQRLYPEWPPSVLDSLAKSRHISEYRKNYQLYKDGQKKGDCVSGFCRFDQRGNLLQDSTTEGHRVYIYDNSGKRTDYLSYELYYGDVVVSEENSYHIYYDRHGNVISHEYFCGSTYRFEYDGRGRVKKVSHYEAEFCDSARNLIEFTVYEYTGRKLTKKLEYDSDSTLLGHTTYSYNSAGKIVQEIGMLANGMVDYQKYSGYDVRGNLIKFISLEEDTLIYNMKYNKLSQLTETQCMNNRYTWKTVYTYDYDKAGNLVTWTKSDQTPPGKIAYRTTTEFTYEKGYLRSYRSMDSHQNGCEVSFSYNTFGSGPEGIRINWIENCRLKIAD
jgi:YD repeat-containing protein